MKRDMSGFVYALTNPGMPGLVKVGFTSKLPEDRAAQLHTTGVPYPFNVEHRCLTMQPKAVEHRAHELLADCRISRSREFFRTEPDRIIEAIELANRTLNGVAAYSKSGVTRIRRGTRIAVPAEPDEILVLLRHSDPLRMLKSPPAIVDVFQVHDPRSQLELYGIGEAGQVPGISDSDFGPVCDPIPYLDRNRRVHNGIIVAIERLFPGDQLVWISGRDPIASRVFEVDDWCQLVGRTWSPSLLRGQYPSLWNHSDREPSEGIVLHARARIATLPTPRSWPEDLGAALADVERKILSSADWLKQLHQ
jgi:hypothetical protein